MRAGVSGIVALLLLLVVVVIGYSSLFSVRETEQVLLVRLGEQRFMLLDPFHGGRAISQPELTAMIRGFVGPDAEVRPEYLAPIPNRAVLVRLLSNQATRAAQSGDLGRALAIHERMARIAPEYPDVWWALAQVQLDGGDANSARASLHAMLEITRDETRRQAATELLGRLGQG